jgi:hypothetical protein
LIVDNLVDTLSKDESQFCLQSLRVRAKGVDSAGAQKQVRVAKFAGQSTYFPAIALVLAEKGPAFATNTMENRPRKAPLKGGD